MISLSDLFSGGGAGGQVNPPDASTAFSGLNSQPSQGFFQNLGGAFMRSRQAGGGLAGLGAALTPSPAGGLKYIGDASTGGTGGAGGVSTVPGGIGGMGGSWGAGGAPGSAAALGQTMNRLGSL